MWPESRQRAQQSSLQKVVCQARATMNQRRNEVLPEPSAEQDEPAGQRGSLVNRVSFSFWLNLLAAQDGLACWHRADVIPATA